MNIEIANRLVELRKKHGYSQEDLATKLGISRQAVSKWERAESSPDTDNLIALSQIYNVSLDEILSQSKENKNDDDFARETKKDQVEKDSTYSAGFREADMKPKTMMFFFPYPIVVVAIFLLLGFMTKRWDICWIVFLTIPIYYGIAAYINYKRQG